MNRSRSEVSPQRTKKIKTEASGCLQCDVFIQCALYEEAKHTYDILVQRRGGSTEAVQATFPLCQYGCLVVDVTNYSSEKVRVLIGWQPNEGLQDATAYCTKVMPELDTRYWIMTGILGGLYEEVQCGDVIVAKRASSIGGKLSGTLAPEARPFEASSVMVNWAKGMASEPNWLKYILPYDIKPSFETSSTDEDVKTKVNRKLPLPMYWCLMDIMHRLHNGDVVEGETGQQRAFRMCTKSGYTKERFGKIMETGIGLGLFNHDGQLTAAGVEELKTGYLKDSFTVFSTGPFPRLPRDIPKVEVEVVVSTEYVRKDLSDPKIVKLLKDATAQRKIKGADMEISAFYQALNDEHKFQKLAVKGVCDWGDMYKDDEYHQIAAEHSAAFVLEFIKRYVRVIKVKSIKEGVDIEVTSTDITSAHPFESLSQDTQSMFNRLLLLRKKKQELIDQYAKVRKEVHENKDFQDLLKELTSTRQRIQNIVSVVSERHNYNPSNISNLSSEIDSTISLISSSLTAGSSFKINHEGKEYEFKAKKSGIHISKSFLTDIYGSEEANSVWKAAQDKAKGPKFTLVGLPQEQYTTDILTSLTGGLLSNSLPSSSTSTSNIDNGAGWSEWRDGTGSVPLKYQYNQEQHLINFQVKGSQTYTYQCPPDKYEKFAVDPNCTSYNQLFNSKRK